MRRYRAANATKTRADARRRFYGLEPTDTAAMLQAQNGRCAICPSAIHDGHDGFCVDHDHATGAVRGLLCRKCNVMLGMAGDNGAVFRAAIAYLEAHE